MQDWMIFKGNKYLYTQKAETATRAKVIAAMKKGLQYELLTALSRKEGLKKLNQLKGDNNEHVSSKNV